jgi:hypothetical protein
MHVLFVHNNYPAQFRYLAPRLAADFGWRCTFATRNTTAPDLPGVERVVYRLRSGAVADSHRFTRAFQNEVGHAHAVYEALRDRPDVRPDLVVAHSGFGASLYLPHLYDCPVVNFFEYFRRPVGGCVGYRPEVGTACSSASAAGSPTGWGGTRRWCGCCTSWCLSSPPRSRGSWCT